MTIVRPSVNRLSRAYQGAPRHLSSRGLHNTPRMTPEWLQSLLDTNTKPPKLYAWGPSNIGALLLSTDLPGSSSISSERCHKPNDSHRRIYILGIGNLGVLYASSLASLPNPPPITLVFHRKDLLQSWRQDPGVEISRGGTVYKHSAFDVELWSEEPPPTGQTREIADGRSIHNLIVTTKASQALPEVDRVRRYLDGSSTVAFAQNGMNKMWPPHGTTYTTSRYSHVAHPNWLACVTTHGVTSLGRFRSFHASEADVKVGPVLLSPEAPQTASYLSEMLTQAPHLRGAAVPRDELWVLQLEKLVVNSIINPLTAVLRCKNGQLFVESDGPIARLMDYLVFEASSVLQALVTDASADSIFQATPILGMSLSSGEINRSDLMNRFSQPRLKSMLYDVGHRVRENTSSMLQDVRAGKLTEIDDFNGWLVETAAYLDENLDVTTHRTLIDLVKNGVVTDAESLSERFPQLTRRSFSG